MFADELLHAYGFRQMALTWTNLQRLGLLKRSEERSKWSQLKRALKLMVDSRPEHEVCSYAGEELWVRLCACVCVAHDELSANTCFFDSELSVRLL